MPVGAGDVRYWETGVCARRCALTGSPFSRRHAARERLSAITQGRGEVERGAGVVVAAGGGGGGGQLWRTDGPALQSASVKKRQRRQPVKELLAERNRNDDMFGFTCSPFLPSITAAKTASVYRP